MKKLGQRNGKEVKEKVANSIAKADRTVSVLPRSTALNANQSRQDEKSVAVQLIKIYWEKKITVVDESGAIVPKLNWCERFDGRVHHHHRHQSGALSLTAGSWLILTVAYSFSDLSLSSFLVILARNKDWWQLCRQSNRSPRVLVDHRVCQVLAGDGNRISIPIRAGSAGFLSVPLSGSQQQLCFDQTWAWFWDIVRC